jgi:TonB family protein
MFNNLIESSSHRKEFKRRGSFFLFTVGTYLLLFVITGVASIYAYDANLGQQSYEINWLPAVNLVEPASAPRDTTPTRPNNDTERSNVTERAEAMLSVNHPEVPPTGISVTPNKNPPIPDTGLVSITGRNREAFGGGPAGPAIDGSRMVKPTGPVVVDAGDPPPAPEALPKPKTINRTRILNSEALSLPKPIYPMLARQARVQGMVAVQVLIDETGRVVSAKVVSGHPLLTLESQKAAMQARFSPTIVGEQPVKVSGVITYNFVMQ